MNMEDDIYVVKLSRNVEKIRNRFPPHILLKLMGWVESVSVQGLRAVRKIPGYHDEPLREKRQGQRSIRLSKAYRAIYVIDESGNIEFIEVIEVNKHEY